MGEIYKSMHEIIPDDVWKQMIQFNRDANARNFVGELVGKMAFTDEPLSTDTVDQYLDVLKKSPKIIPRNIDGVLFLDDDLMASLQGVLSPGQFAVLQQQQIIHRADQKLANLKNN
jgi:hypothetical protein